MDPVDMLLDPIRVGSTLLIAGWLLWRWDRRRRDRKRIAERLRALQRWWVGP